MSVRVLLRAFSAGEITPELFSRVDVTKQQEGLATCRNFITLPHGPAINRPGTEFVREVKTSANATRLIPFSYNNTQVFAIEVGAGYFRFHTNAATLLYTDGAAWVTLTVYAVGDIVKQAGVNYYCTTAHTAGVFATDLAAGNWYAMPTGPNIYEIPNTFAAADLLDIHYVQSADVLSLTHPNYPPLELRRYGATNWQTKAITFSPTLPPPTVAGGAGTPIVHSYKVAALVQPPTSIQWGNLAAVLGTGTPPKESQASGAFTCSNDLTQTGAYNTLKWSPVTNASLYYVFKLSGGIYGLLAVTSSPNFVDDGGYTSNVARVPLGTSTSPAAPGGTSATATAAGGATIIAVATTGAGGTTYDYVVTAVDASANESYQSSNATCTNDLTTSPNKNTVTWPAVTGAVRYNVYRKTQGIYGYIGQAAGTSFVDQNISPDVTKTPPLITDPFNGTGNYPAAVSYFEQRRCFAGSNNQPQNLWMTRSGTESDMSYTIPVRDDNRIAIRVAAREASAIRHIVPAQSLLLLTASGEWRVTSVNSDAITPTSISVRPQSYIGASNVMPVLVGGIVLFAAARGGHLREMSYNWQANGFLTGDVSLFAPHLFDYYTIQDMAYSKGPVPVLWAVSSTGRLLGMTYVPEQQVSAWHRHDTGIADAFESVCVITENNEDMLYCVIRRTVNGATKRYVERLHTRNFTALADAFFVDCGATYSGAATGTVTGLTWLEGMTVNILADGAVMPQQVVTGGAITLPNNVTASTITVGLPITADIQTLPLAGQIDPAFGQGRPKNVNRIFLRTYRASGILAGPSFDSLVPYRQRTTEPYGSPPDLVSDEIEIALNASWSAGGQICVRQSDPLPLDIASITAEIALGGG